VSRLRGRAVRRASHDSNRSLGRFRFLGASTCFYCFASRLRTIRLGAGKPDYIPLSVETGNKHWTVVRIAVWLVKTNERWLAAFWRHISQPFAIAALTKLCGTSAKLNRVICTEGRKAKLHCPIMFIAERQNVRAHWSSLASAETLVGPCPSGHRG
jgi:hypothetical protein